MAEFLQAFVKWWIAGPHLDLAARRRFFWVFGLMIVIPILMAFPMMELGFLFSLDLGLLFEVSALMYVLAVRDNGRALLQSIRQLPATARRMFSAARRGFRRARRTLGGMLKPPGASDENGPWPVFALG